MLIRNEQSLEESLPAANIFVFGNQRIAHERRQSLLQAEPYDLPRRAVGIQDCGNENIRIDDNFIAK